MLRSFVLFCLMLCSFRSLFFKFHCFLRRSFFFFLSFFFFFFVWLFFLFLLFLSFLFTFCDFHRFLFKLVFSCLFEFQLLWKFKKFYNYISRFRILNCFNLDFCRWLFYSPIPNLFVYVFV